MNVILITVDSLRADHIGSFGYGKDLTPNLDRIAKSGILFTNAFSYGSTTFTSIPPLLTSSPFISHFYYNELYNDINKSMELHDSLSRYKKIISLQFESNITIAKALKDNGYNTAAFNSNPYLSKYYGYGKDFLHYDDSFSENDFKKKIIEKVKISLMGGKIEKLAKRLYFLMNSNNIPYERAERINEKAISYLKKEKPEKFFLWLHYMDTHVPYKPPKSFCPRIGNFKISDLSRKILSNEPVSCDELEQLIELYDGCIKYVDYSIKCLLDDLNNMDTLNNTIIIITADHGEEFKEHGDFLHIETKLYDELIHVPLIIYNSGYSAMSDEAVSHLDIAPTIMDLLDLPKVKTFRGKSMISLIKGEKSDGVISEGIGSKNMGDRLKLLISYRTKKWKFIMNKMKDENELYDIQNDPNEKKNLNDLNKDKADEIKLRVSDYISRQQEFVEMDAKKETLIKNIKKLRAAGKLVK